MHYSNQRKLTNSESMEIEGVLKRGANKKLAKQQIPKKFGKVTTLKDIQKLCMIELKNEQFGQKDAQIFLDKLSRPCTKTHRQLVELLWMMKTICPFFTTDLVFCHNFLPSFQKLF